MSSSKAERRAAARKHKEMLLEKPVRILVVGPSGIAKSEFVKSLVFCSARDVGMTPTTERQQPRGRLNAMIKRLLRDTSCTGSTKDVAPPPQPEEVQKPCLLDALSLESLDFVIGYVGARDLKCLGATNGFFADFSMRDSRWLTLMAERYGERPSCGLRTPTACKCRCHDEKEVKRRWGRRQVAEVASSEETVETFCKRVRQPQQLALLDRLYFPTTPAPRRIRASIRAYKRCPVEIVLVDSDSLTLDHELRTTGPIDCVCVLYDPSLAHDAPKLVADLKVFYKNAADPDQITVPVFFAVQHGHNRRRTCSSDACCCKPSALANRHKLAGCEETFALLDSPRVFEKEIWGCLLHNAMAYQQFRRFMDPHDPWTTLNVNLLVIVQNKIREALAHQAAARQQEGENNLVLF